MSVVVPAEPPALAAYANENDLVNKSVNITNDRQLQLVPPDNTPAMTASNRRDPSPNTTMEMRPPRPNQSYQSPYKQ